jgi:hypothetical protein
MENNLSMPELIAILTAQQEQDYENKKFLAALNGVDLDGGKEEQSTWEEIKARAYQKVTGVDSNDVVSLQGGAAARAGFGIGIGLDYEVM